MRVSIPVIDIVSSPGADQLERQALFGEKISVLEIVDGFAFGRCETNGYVGYLSAKGLADWITPTHRVNVRASLGFNFPDIKSSNPMAFSFGSRFAIVGEQNGFLEASDGIFFPKQHLAPLEKSRPVPVATARLFLGAPYLWGGNSVFGIDCSGLIQAAFQPAGLLCPGDSDLQSRMPGLSLEESEADQPGDLLFWQGHVAMVSEPDRIIHANGHHMSVVEEERGPALERISGEAGPITGCLRVTNEG